MFFWTKYIGISTSLIKVLELLLDKWTLHIFEEQLTLYSSMKATTFNEVSLYYFILLFSPQVSATHFNWFARSNHPNAG